MENAAGKLFELAHQKNLELFRHSFSAIVHLAVISFYQFMLSFISFLRLIHKVRHSSNLYSEISSILYIKMKVRMIVYDNIGEINYKMYKA